MARCGINATGSPRPSVVWYKATQLLDSYMESQASGNTTEEAHSVEGFTTLEPGPKEQEEEPITAYQGEPFNTLTLGPLSRGDLQLLLTCEAFNNNITSAASVSVSVDMNLSPLSVEIRPPEEDPLTAGVEYRVACVVVGARPSPALTWWINQHQLLQAEVTTSADGNVTTSTVLLNPRPEDHGSILRCVVGLPAILEDSYNLTVNYIPKATCSFGSSLNSGNIKEGDDVYFECTIEANPRVTHVSWRHNDAELVHNVSAGIIISNQSLVLQKVYRAQAGRYSCHAHNLVGDGASNSLRLDVKYAPVCSLGQVTTYAVGRYEDAEVTCSVDANPVQESFQWTFNNTADTIDVPQGRFTSTKSHSVITYTPMTSLDYGTLLCWATNAIGSQRDPCVFHIVPAGKPDSPSNCTVGLGTSTSVKLKCVAGGSGGLPQHFHLQASLHQGQHTFNFTSHALPVFQVSV
ncbi:nephrin-like [Homarus americanus]|uniref:nephrin-like n=1 Tax=Homarus americanus TaxID=6706 RepID=UPI001C44B482|nr:nephrin-like [Homarus americanus]